MSVERIDHKILAESRLVTQFKNSVNLINYIKTLLVEAQTLEDVFLDIISSRYLDNAEGVQLDIIGSIVGQSREFVDAELFIYFGFLSNPQSQSFGNTDDPGEGGRFLGAGEPSTGIRILDDEEYYRYIKAKITRNSTGSTRNDIISAIKYIFDAGIVIIQEGDTSYTISIGKILTLNEKVLLTSGLIPKTAGVEVSYTSEFDSNNFFGFAGVPTANGLGSTTNDSLGGTMGSLI